MLGLTQNRFKRVISPLADHTVQRGDNQRKRCTQFMTDVCKKPEFQFGQFFLHALFMFPFLSGQEKTDCQSDTGQTQQNVYGISQSGLPPCRQFMDNEQLFGIAPYAITVCRLGLKRIPSGRRQQQPERVLSDRQGYPLVTQFTDAIGKPDVSGIEYVKRCHANLHHLRRIRYFHDLLTGKLHQAVTQQRADDRRSGHRCPVKIIRRSQAEDIAGRPDIYTVTYGTDTAEKIYPQTFVGRTQNALRQRTGITFADTLVSQGPDMAKTVTTDPVYGLSRRSTISHPRNGVLRVLPVDISLIISPPQSTVTVTPQC